MPNATVRANAQALPEATELSAAEHEGFERIVGEPRDSILLLALGSIKADLMNLGINRGDI